MKHEEEFLAAYKEYEGLLREKGIDTKTYEESSPYGDRLRYCRNVRNYLSHQNDPGFISISDKQISFLLEITESLKMEGNPVKKFAKTLKAGAVLDTDLCLDAVLKMKKLKIPYILVMDHTDLSVLGYISIFDASEAAIAKKTSKVSSVKKTTAYISYKDEMTDIDSVSKDEPTILTKKNDTIVGVYYPKGFLV